MMIGSAICLSTRAECEAQVFSRSSSDWLNHRIRREIRPVLCTWTTSGLKLRHDLPTVRGYRTFQLGHRIREVDIPLSVRNKNNTDQNRGFFQETFWLETS